MTWLLLGRLGIAQACKIAPVTVGDGGSAVVGAFADMGAGLQHLSPPRHHARRSARSVSDGVTTRSSPGRQ